MNGIDSRKKTRPNEICALRNLLDGPLLRKSRSRTAGSAGCTLVSMVALLCMLPFVVSQTTSSATVDVGNLIERSECYDPLYKADANKNGKVDRQEYVTFLNEVTLGYFEYVNGKFASLPQSMIANFNDIACLCRTQYNGPESCCENDNAHINATGVGPNETPTPAEITYLYVACDLTFIALSKEVTMAPSHPPTFSPTEMPTFPKPTIPPTNPPTMRPTSTKPTIPPTDPPTLPPTEIPTFKPTFPKPTGSPTNSPTEAPITGTRKPTLSPRPTFIPTVMPTPFPTAVPTALPSGQPTFPKPTMPPTLAPTLFTGDITIDVSFLIGRPSDSSVDVESLEAALDALLEAVIAETYQPGRVRRRLAVEAKEGASIYRMLPDDCPELFPAGEFDCEIIQATLIVSLENEDPADVRAKVKEAFLAAIAAGRLQTTLQNIDPDVKIRVVPPGGTLAPSPTVISPRETDDDDGLGTTGKTLIAAAAGIMLLGAGIGLFISRRNAADKEGPGTARNVDTSVAPRSPGGYGSGTLGASSPNYGSQRSSKSRQLVGGFATLEDEGSLDETGGAKSPRAVVDDSGESSSNAGSSGWSSSAGISSLNTDSLEDEPSFGATLAAIGAASAVTGKVIAKDSTKDSTKSELAAKPEETKKSAGSGEVPDLPAVTKKDLDSAIEAGDWAAVGATAALLAASSDTQSLGSKKSSSARSRSTVSSIDAARAAELDQLVDAGDWEGVVLAAAKFESEGSVTVTSEDRFGGSTTTGRSTTEQSVGTSSVYSPSVSSTVSETPSKQQKRAEIRKEVEALVRRVVPDEIDNVDEMMLQFKGREEELVETLRTMQERSIAQRARAAVHKSAKREARKSRADAAKQGTGLGFTVPTAGASSAGVPSSGGGGGGGNIGAAVAAGVVGGVAVGGAAAAAARNGREKEKEEQQKTSQSTFDHSEDFSEPQFKESTKAPTSSPATPLLTREEEGGKAKAGSSSGSISRNAPSRSALELAIEAGDWDAVGEAAAMMSDNSITTASTNEINALAEVNYDTDRTSSSYGSRGGMSGVNAERAAELDKMIDRGDWSGVVAAASRFSTSDKKGGSVKSGSQSSSTSSKRKKRGWGMRQKGKSTKSSDSDTASLDKDKALQEEQDALAQAEIWMAIAAQSRTEGGTEAKGASDAADWAISRSLHALRSAEQKGELSSKAGSNVQNSSGASSGDGGSSQGDKSV